MPNRFPRASPCEQESKIGMHDPLKAMQRFLLAEFEITVVAIQATKMRDSSHPGGRQIGRSHVACTKKMHTKQDNPRYSIAPQRKAEKGKGREKQRKAEKGREMQRKAEKGRAGTMTNSSFTL